MNRLDQAVRDYGWPVVAAAIFAGLMALVVLVHVPLWVAAGQVFGILGPQSLAYAYWGLWVELMDRPVLASEANARPKPKLPELVPDADPTASGWQRPKSVFASSRYDEGEP